MKKNSKTLLYIITSVILLLTFFSCGTKKTESLQNSLPVKDSIEKPKFVSIAIEDVITTLTVENRNRLISEIEKEHKHNDFVDIETAKEGSPIIIIFETIKGVNKYTGSRTTYNKYNEKKTDYFTTLTPMQLKKLKETFSSGWKDDK
jgi:hypothetical protein